MSQSSLNSLIFLLLTLILLPGVSCAETTQFLNIDNDLKWQNSQQLIQNVHDFQGTYGIKYGMPAYIATHAVNHLADENSTQSWGKVVLEAAISSVAQYSLQLQNPDSSISDVIITPKFDGETIGVAVSMKF